LLYHLTSVDPNAPRKRRSRWGEAKTEIPGLPTAISAAGVSQAQLDNYAIHLRLEEINRKLRLNDYIPPERERCALFLFALLTQSKYS
jgi:splicing factor 1